ncbi:hypothetical protein LDENG_00256880 [Lucifuga dentata]|nr:hypothetical protein LDENG_00256880 [Lucifuga dentata]
MEEEGPRGDMTIQSGLSNSTESIDSMKALTAAIEAANAQVHGPASQHVSNSSMTVSTSTPSLLSRGPAAEEFRNEYRKDALRKGKCLSIGIQVDGPEEVHDLEDPSKFTSVGVQVDDDRGYRRFKRSNSVTAAVQPGRSGHAGPAGHSSRLPGHRHGCPVIWRHFPAILP